MLTPEQINNLKNSDKLLVQGEFIKAHDNGSILVSLSTKEWESSIHELLFFHPSSVFLPSEHGTSVPTPKHAPTRLFKKGDVVTPRSGKTVLASEYGFVTFHELAGQYEVNEDEARGTVTLIVNGHACFVSAFALELVTPVEELEPYKLIDSPNTYNIVRDSAMVMTIHKKSHPNPKAAAEAECARLNAEWRKEHNND